MNKCIAYMSRRFSAESLALIDFCNAVLAQSEREGYQLTLRSLYYRCVSQNVIANNEREYDRLGSLIDHARWCGLVSWDDITDRTRTVRSVSHWDKPGDIIESAAESFRLDKWDGQEIRPEVWVEKDALAATVERACTALDVPWFSARGYSSVSALWVAAQRLSDYADNGQRPIIFHLGDHDPSGKDMTRDIERRVNILRGRTGDPHTNGEDEDLDRSDFAVIRLALNKDQVDQYKPPPNPAKLTDARSKAYIAEYGEYSWELDALQPSILDGIIRAAVGAVRNQESYDHMVNLEKIHRAQLKKAAEQWDDLKVNLT